MTGSTKTRRGRPRASHARESALPIMQHGSMAALCTHAFWLVVCSKLCWGHLQCLVIALVSSAVRCYLARPCACAGLARIRIPTLLYTTTNKAATVVTRGRCSLSLAKHRATSARAASTKTSSVSCGARRARWGPWRQAMIHLATRPARHANLAQLCQNIRRSPTRAITALLGIGW